MTYTLDEFCADSRAILKTEPLADALAHIAERLGRLLSNPAFVAETFSDDMPPGRRVLYRDAETDFRVLAHVQEGNKTGKPHSHGSSWAIYGNAREHTDMVEWRRTNPESEKHAVLQTASRYRLGPGETKAYGPRGDPFDRASEEGLGDPRHRHRSRCAPALSFRQGAPPAGTGVSPAGAAPHHPP
jgi:hypothetical protein